MRCFKCGSEKLSVIDSRDDGGGGIRRRRLCQDCEFRFTTYEKIELTLPMVVKKDMRREVFDREKLKSGILIACRKRPISAEVIDQMIDRVENTLYEKFSKEVQSSEIGNIVMAELKEIDKVAYIRFVSVYREFSDIAQFVDELNYLE
ncbi:MAG: transcriptional regulator NrdR [Bdellovibrionota bacterium]